MGGRREGTIGLVVDFYQGLVDVVHARSVDIDFRHRPENIRWAHDLVVTDDFIFENSTKNVPSTDGVTHFEIQWLVLVPAFGRRGKRGNPE